MSGTEPETPPPEMPAAEYVLGTLDGAEVEAARARLARDPAFAAEVRLWESFLVPLATMVEPVQPPAAVWDRIGRSIGSTRAASRPANDNRVLVWRTAALASMALAASLAAFIVLRPPQPPTFAVLLPTGVTAPVLVGFGDGTRGAIDLRFNAPPTIAPARDLQLWSLPAGASRPTSLGLLSPEGRLLPPGIALGTRLLVSSEPKGGSPTGLPTGPVVYGGVVSRR